MTSMINELKFFSSYSDFEKCAYTQMRSYHWEATPPYRPKTFFKIGVVKGELNACLKTYEKEPRALYLNRDEPVYKDSCLEFFVAPVNGRDEYINVETNSKGTFLAEFGKGKYDRKLLSSLSSVSPQVSVFFGDDEIGGFWGVRIQLPEKLISEIYGVPEADIKYNVIKANFYKCGDDCVVPHYIAFSPVGALPPGFHNPDCFAEFIKNRS